MCKYKQAALACVAGFFVTFCVVSQGALVSAQETNQESNFEIRQGICYGYHGDESVITLPRNVSVIDRFAFAGHPTISRAILPQEIDQIGAKAFSACPHLTQLIIYNRNATLEPEAILPATVGALTIVGWRNSTAHQYADAYQIPFQPLDPVSSGQTGTCATHPTTQTTVASTLNQTITSAMSQTTQKSYVVLTTMALSTTAESVLFGTSNGIALRWWVALGGVILGIAIAGILSNRPAFHNTDFTKEDQGASCKSQQD